MTSPDPFVVVLITVLVVGAIIQLLVLTYRYRNGELGPQGRAIDGDVVHREEGVNDPLPAGQRDDDGDLDLDPSETDAVLCPQCRTPNEASYTFCRSCVAKLSEI